MTRKRDAIGKFGRAALAYAERLGWPVFPLKFRGKEPCVPKLQGGRGHSDATTDRHRILEWWQRWPEANVAIACDKRSGLLALDVDPRNGGDDELAELEALYGPLPHTVEALTGGGGRHLIYRRPAGVEFKGRLCEGVDIKANGYIVAAPSTHESGGTYCWEVCGHPFETELAELPSWVLQRILTYETDNQYGQPADDCANSFLALAFRHAGWLGKRIDSVRINARCPWENEHTVKSGSGGSIIYAPKQGSAAGWFHCSHTSHGKKTMQDVMAVLPHDAIQQACADIALQAGIDAIDEDDERAAIKAEGNNQ